MADFRVEGIIEVDSSRAVRDLAKFNNQLKKTFAEVRGVVKAVNDLDGMRARVNLDAEKAKADAAFVKAQIEELKREKAEIDLTVASAKAELTLAKIRKEVSDLDRTKADVEIGMHGPYTEIAELENAIRAIDEQDVSIEVELDAMKAVREAAALNAELDALIDNHKEVKIDVDRSGFDQLRNAIDGATFSLGSLGRGGLIGGLAVLATTLAPLTGIATGVAAGMVGSMATMGLSVGAFTGFAIPTIKEVIEGFKLLDEEVENLSPEKLEEYNKKMAELKNETPKIYEAAQAVKALKDRFMELSEEMRPIVLTAFISGLGAASIVLEEMAPVAKEAGKAIRDLMADAKEGLKGEEWQTFFGYLKENARGFTQVWGETWGNFITGIANMIVAFDPLTKFVNQGFLDMSESFRKWSEGLAENEGFKNFVDFVITNGPMVWDALKGVGRLLLDIGIALTPLGLRVLEMIDSFGEWYGKMREVNPELASMATAIALIGAASIPFAGTITGLIGPLAGIVTSLSGLAALAAGLGILAGTLTAIGVALALTTDTGEPFRAMWDAINSAWEATKESAMRVWERLQALWEFFKDLGIIENFQSAIADLAAAWEEMLPIVELLATVLGGALMAAFLSISISIKVVAAVVKWLATEFRGLYDQGVVYWGKLKNFITQTVPRIYNNVKDWFSKLPGMMRDKVEQAKSWVVNKFNEMKTNVGNSIQLLKALAQSKFEEIKNAIRDKVTNAVQTVRQKFTDMKNTAQSVISAMVGAVRSKFEEIISAIRSKISQAPGVVRDKINAAKQALVSAMAQMVAGAARAVVNIISEIRNGMSRAKAAVIGAFAGAGGWLLSAGKQIIQGLVSGIGSMIGAVRDKLGSITNMIPDWKGPAEKDAKLLRPVGQLIMKGLIKGFDDGTEGVKNVLERVTQLIMDTMDKRFKDSEKAEAASKAVIKSLEDEASALMRNARQRDVVMGKIDKQREKLEGLIQAQKQYAASVRDSFMDFGSIGNLGARTDEEGNPLALSAGNIVEDLRSKVGQAKEYKEYMDQLIEMGINKETLDQLTNMGVEAGLATAKAIVEGGAKTIEEINLLTEQLMKTGQNMGNQVAKEMYGAGIQATRGIIRGLREKKRELIAVARELGRAMTRAFRQELKIKSPSRIFIDYGHMTGAGLVKGLKDEIPKVESATKALTDSMNSVGAVNPLGWAQNFSVSDTHASSNGSGGGEGATPPVEVKVYIGDRELTDIVRVEVGDTIKPLRTKTRQGAI